MWLTCYLTVSTYYNTVQAVRGTRPYQVAGARTDTGLPVWFTRIPGRVNDGTYAPAVTIQTNGA